MKNLTRRLLYEGPDVGRKNVIWNIAGSFAYAFASMVLSFLVIRMAGEEKGGIFSFGYSTLGQQLFIVAYFGLRPFQITDGAGESSFADYREHRNITCITALAAGAVFLTLMHGLGRYSASKSTILLLLIIYKVIDGYADVYESEFQRQGSLYLTGKSNFFRTILSVSVFLITLAAFGNLLFSCAAAVAAQAAGVALFNLDVIRALPGVDWKRREGSTGDIFRKTAVLFLSVFLDFYVFSAAKYAIDGRMDDASSGYFNLIFMPTSVIYLIANFVIRPFLTKLTALWSQKEYPSFLRELKTIGRVILGLTVLAVFGAAVLGKWALSVMERFLGAGYGGSLTGYYGAFVIIVAGGGFYAMANLVYYALVIMRRQKVIFLVYLGAAFVAAPLSVFLVSHFGIYGAAFCYLLLMAGLTAGFSVCLRGAYSREVRENEKENSGDGKSQG